MCIDKENDKKSVNMTYIVFLQLLVAHHSSHLISHHSSSCFYTLDADFKSEPVCVDKLLQRHQIFRIKCGFKDTGWITPEHL